MATHYVPESALETIIFDIQQLANPSSVQISTLIANHSAPPPTKGTAPSSKASRDGHTPIKADIMDFLDHAFGQSSIQEVYAELEKAENDYEVKDDIRAWAGEQKKIMHARSPTGMAVALEGYQQAKQAKRLDVTLENGTSPPSLC